MTEANGDQNQDGLRLLQCKVGMRRHGSVLRQWTEGTVTETIDPLPGFRHEPPSTLFDGRVHSTFRRRGESGLPGHGLSRAANSV